jgi:hypothetical protein
VVQGGDRADGAAAALRCDRQPGSRAAARAVAGGAGQTAALLRPRVRHGDGRQLLSHHGWRGPAAPASEERARALACRSACCAPGFRRARPGAHGAGFATPGRWSRRPAADSTGRAHRRSPPVLANAAAFDSLEFAQAPRSKRAGRVARHGPPERQAALSRWGTGGATGARLC